MGVKGKTESSEEADIQLSSLYLNIIEVWHSTVEYVYICRYK